MVRSSSVGKGKQHRGKNKFDLWFFFFFPAVIFSFFSLCFSNSELIWRFISFRSASDKLFSSLIFFTRRMSMSSILEDPLSLKKSDILASKAVARVLSLAIGMDL